MRRLFIYLLVAFIAYFIGIFAYELRCPMTWTMHLKQRQHSVATLIQQTAPREQVTELLKFSVSIDEPTWALLAPYYATLHVQNSSDIDIALRGPGTFHLDNRFSRKPRDRFYSSSALPGSTEVRSTPAGEQTVHRSWIKCQRHSSAEIKINLTDLKWGRAIGAEGPNQSIHQVLSTGSYDLSFTFLVSESKNSEIAKSTMFVSSKVVVRVD